MANSTHLATVTATAWTTGSNGQQQQVHSGPGSILFVGIQVDFLFFGTSVYRWGIYGWIVQLFFILGVQWACFCLSFDAANIGSTTSNYPVDAGLAGCKITRRRQSMVEFI